MKKLFIVAVLGLGSFMTGHAQEHAIKANPIGLAFGIANAGYEFEVNESQSATVSGLFYNIGDANGFGIGAEYRFYFSSKDALNGWHAGPTAGYVSLSDDFDNSAGFLSVGGQAGHQWIFGEHFLLDVFAGLSFVTGDSDSLAVSINSTAVGLGVSLGYAW
ncbi:Hypothetical protein I595_3467 [Croceitalea dokdonensis DOKDO 023]|uniref:Outer membrane protein beta-barrel domain-containing protein n=1 Tax=Croceitalea dokdonensis DOKDO 023 TaxID=1300341 RepID=A0A0P7A1Y0_9FLAO|nr:DUF3575 domain-containing protein [Croceitalea dokdonensis]KPM30446.1 Hypothetical protein I595_3467 [Croceitalea dokdonensis DOKDO 023]